MEAALDHGTPTTVSLCLDGAAQCLAASGRHREAAQAVGASEAWLTAVGASATTVEEAARAAALATAAQALGSERTAEAAAAGAHLTPDDLRTLAAKPPPTSDNVRFHLPGRCRRTTVDWFSGCVNRAHTSRCRWATVGTWPAIHQHRPPGR